MSSWGNNMRKEQCIRQRLHQDSCIPLFLAPITMRSSRTCKTSDNEHFFRLSNSCTSNLLLLHLSSWIPIEIVEEACTFCILQLHKESTSHSRLKKKSMAVIWSTSHCSSSWTTFTYINCWLKHNRLIQAKC